MNKFALTFLAAIGSLSVTQICCSAALSEPMQRRLASRATSREKMCSSLLQDASYSEEGLTLDKVKKLFEESLDTMSKAIEHMNKIQPPVDEGASSKANQRGGSTILDIAEKRRKLIEDYNRAKAKGASQAEVGKILEKYFFKACANKIAMAITEQSLYDSLTEVQRIQRLRKDSPTKPI